MPYSYQNSFQNKGGDKPVQARPTQLDGRSFEELRRECLQKKRLFEDPDFPACDSSIYYSESVPINFSWKRPGELAQDPKFILGGATRTDICQGELGDCWLLAAIASLTLNEQTLARVVPPDQDFDQNYAGIFHFQFWKHNEWIDVVIDDRLPAVRNRLVFLHSAENNEFWSALLEKAYAKLYGSYEALKGGSTVEAMEDFTGGVGEMYDTKKAPDNLYQIIQKALDRGSMLGCSINISSSAESEARTTTGLVKGHAYSITGLDEVNYRGRKVKLIRVRNPWGQVEWNGPWSDNSREWSAVDREEKKRLNQNALDDGEFWMEFEDFKTNYDQIEICNLSPDALTDDTARSWVVTLFEGSWVRGSTAGGCRNFIDTFWTNPQFKVTLTDADDDDDDVCTFIVALMQKNRRQLRKEGLDLETIGFTIYEAPEGEDQASKDFFRYNPSKARSKTYINLREVSERFTLPPGQYIIVPTIFQPHKEADFLLVFSEKKAESVEMGSTIEADLPETETSFQFKIHCFLSDLFPDLFHILIVRQISIIPPRPSLKEEESNEEKGLRRLFEQIAGPDKAICAEELQTILNGVLSRRKEIKFDGLTLNTCQSIINLMDVSFLKLLDWKPMIYYIIFWRAKSFKNHILFCLQMLFLTFDTDRSGCLSSYELRAALSSIGIRLNNKILQLLALRFADSQFNIDFDDYLTCLVRLENMFRVFQALDRDNSGEISLNFQQVGLTEKTSEQYSVARV
ncbi:CAN9 protein, partial [Atractosteus spatula]|nr:CAN9 protein [Atractosteus spatula]